jgi:hypothetical protein
MIPELLHNVYLKDFFVLGAYQFDVDVARRSAAHECDSCDAPEQQRHGDRSARLQQQARSGRRLHTIECRISLDKWVIMSGLTGSLYLSSNIAAFYNN